MAAVLKVMQSVIFDAKDITSSLAEKIRSEHKNQKIIICYAYNDLSQLSKEIRDDIANEEAGYSLTDSQGVNYYITETKGHSGGSNDLSQGKGHNGGSNAVIQGMTVAGGNENSVNKPTKLKPSKAKPRK
jgi:hypothetical protein